MKRTIVMLGVGSTYFTRGIVEALIRWGGEWEVRMVDIVPEYLDIAMRLGKKMVDLYQSKVVIKGSLERRDMLPGADAVVCTIGVGGRKAWFKDVDIPRRFNIFQHTGDTYGAGGISRSLRTIPVLVEVAKDIEELCPKAILVNFTNPMTTCTRAITKTSSVKAVGLCCGVRAFHRRLANIAGVKDTEVFCKAVGPNHFTWILDMVHEGKSILPKIREKMAKTDMPKNQPLTWDLFTTFDAFPCVGDGHISEFIPGVLGEGTYYGRTGGDRKHVDEYVRDHWDKVFQDMKDQADGKVAVTKKPEPSETDDFSDEDMFVEVLSSYMGEGEMFRTVNMPNKGIVTNVQQEAILECTTFINGAGFHPLAFGDIPQGIATTIQRIAGAQELAVEASLKADRQLVLQALMASLTVNSRSEAEKLADAILTEHREYLPRFFK